MDAVLMVKTLVPDALYNLSDDRIEYKVRDRCKRRLDPTLLLMASGAR